MAWDTDLLQAHIDFSFDVPFTKQEVLELSTRGGFAESDDTDDYEDDEAEGPAGERFPAICDSCIHLSSDDYVCAAFPDEIPLASGTAQLHDVPLPGQGNDIVYQADPSKTNEREWFLKYHAAMNGLPPYDN
jgi:hypothetical protein